MNQGHLGLWSGGALFLAALTAAPMAAQAAGARGMRMQEAPAFVEVSATAQVSVPADRGEIRFAVETQARTAANAATDNAARMEAVIDALRALEVDGTDIETSGYQLNPVYARPAPGEAQRITGYRALNHVVLAVDDVDALGRVIDAAIGAGANRVAGLSFIASDTEEARLEAVQRAVRKARSEAEAMAAALGVPLGAPMEVRGGAQTPGPVPFRMEAFAMEAAETPVEPGDQIVRASVTVKFRLGSGS